VRRTFIHSCIHAYIHTYVRINVCFVYVRTHVPACIHTYARPYIYAYIHIVRAHVYINIQYTDPCTDIHTHIHINNIFHASTSKSE
jgi:hypothetical protein